jgi:hypothetical protein
MKGFCESGYARSAIDTLGWLDSLVGNFAIFIAMAVYGLTAAAFAFALKVRRTLINKVSGSKCIP